ncbi:phage integrase N-terminal SAM-like domain-containing protein [Alteromonas sp. ASW11-130]|uniref:phage integrase N-terminal SAM-like domain-containing protein n=1 Tax=Alteromonas sp. ASW11-130 TaxID=3015775 RepID=UPI003FA44217
MFKKRRPKNLREHEVTTILTHFAVDRHVTSSAQNFAVCTLVFMYKTYSNERRRGLRLPFGRAHLSAFLPLDVMTKQ